MTTHCTNTTSANARARRLAAVAVTLILAGCGSSDDDSDAAAGTTTAGGETIGGTVAATEPAAVTTEPAAATTALPEVNILTDFADVCRGVTLPGAEPYDPAQAGVHPVMFAIGEHPAYDDIIASMPSQWAPVSGQEHTTQLVACIARTSATLVQTCDGYEDDGVDTGNTVEMYDATYDVRLLAATTGEEVAATSLTATSGDCPMLFFFDPDSSVGLEYAEPTDELTTWMAPLVET